MGRAFIVRMDPERPGPLLENVGTRERVLLADLSEVPDRIRGWLQAGAAADEAQGGPDAHAPTP